MKKEELKETEDIDDAYKEMLELLKDKNKRDIILEILHIKIEPKTDNITFEGITKVEKHKIRLLRLKSKKCVMRRKVLKFHNCLNCLNYSKNLKEGNTNASYCRILIKPTIDELYSLKKKCDLFTK